MTRIGGMIEAMMIEIGEIIEDTTGIEGMTGDTIGIEEMIDEMIVDMIGEMTEEVTEETEETTHARKHQ